MTPHNDPPEPSPSPGSGLNAAQARAVRATFTQVSELLDEVLRLCQGRLNPFDAQQADITPFEARRGEALVEEMRGRLLTALDELGISRPKPEGSARWSATTAFLYAEIALSELSPETLRGYGAVDQEAVQAVAGVAEHLKALANQGQALFRGGS